MDHIEFQVTNNGITTGLYHCLWERLPPNTITTIADVEKYLEKYTIIPTNQLGLYSGPFTINEKDRRPFAKKFYDAGYQCHTECMKYITTVTVIPKVDQSWSIVRIVEEASPTSWKSCFLQALPEFKHISKKLDDEKVFGSYMPLKRDLFNAFRYTDLDDVKVILLDYEPLNQLCTIDGRSMPRDMGLAYSVRYNDQVPKMFDNI